MNIIVSAVQCSDRCGEEHRPLKNLKLEDISSVSYSVEKIDPTEIISQSDIGGSLRGDIHVYAFGRRCPLLYPGSGFYRDRTEILWEHGEALFMCALSVGATVLDFCG